MHAYAESTISFSRHLLFRAEPDGKEQKADALCRAHVFMSFDGRCSRDDPFV